LWRKACHTDVIDAASSGGQGRKLKTGKKFKNSALLKSVKFVLGVRLAELKVLHSCCLVGDESGSTWVEKRKEFVVAVVVVAEVS
jgi:hypothetical protein